MKNITLSADEELIDAARAKARSKQTTLNAEFRHWLKRYARSDDQAQQSIRAYRRFMTNNSAVSTGGKHFSRDELNAR